MKRTEILFLACVLAMAALFGGRTLSETVRAMGWEEGEAAPAGTAGRPRDVDMEKLDRLTREGLLSDREALYYRKLAAPAAGPAQGDFTTVRKFQVMGTEAEVTVLLPAARMGAESGLLEAAEGALRRADALLSDHDEGAEIFRLNAAAAGDVRLSEPARRVLGASRRFHRQTGGAFDVTCGPLVERWRRAGRENRLPDPAGLGEARARSNWDLLELTAEGVVKKGEGVRVDLGGIAKGYGVDRAIEEVRIAGAEGAMVNAGGDLRVFGRSPGGGPWRVAVRHPFKPETVCARLAVSSGAVCTSGNYLRFAEIEGRRYSHILDPRTGRPADAASSVTVAAPEAMTADAWATALSVLGPAGLELLPAGEGIEALIISGSPESPRVDMTPGFRDFLASGPDF